MHHADDDCRGGTLTPRSELSLHGYQHRLSVCSFAAKAFLAEACPGKTDSREYKHSASLRPRFRVGCCTCTNVASRHVLPWLPTEQACARKNIARLRLGCQHREIPKKAVGIRCSGLARMPNALILKKAFASVTIRFEELINVAHRPRLCVAWRHCSRLVGLSVIESEARDFLEYLLEMNSTRVQSTLSIVQKARTLEVRSESCFTSKPGRRTRAEKRARPRAGRRGGEASSLACAPGKRRSIAFGRLRKCFPSSVLLLEKSLRKRLDCPKCGGTSAQRTPGRSRKSLRAALRHSEPQTRVRAAWILGERKEVPGVPDLMA